MATKAIEHFVALDLLSTLKVNRTLDSWEQCKWGSM